MVGVQTYMHNHIKIVCCTHRNKDQISFFNGRVDICGEEEVFPTTRQHHFIQAWLQQQEKETHFRTHVTKISHLKKKKKKHFEIIVITY